MGRGPSLTKHLNRWNSTRDSSQEHWKLFDFRICWSYLYVSYFLGIHIFPYFWRASFPVLTGRTAKLSKVGKAVPPFDSHKTKASLKQQVKIKIQLQNNHCTFQMDLMCTRSSLLLLLEGMEQFLPSPERRYCYSQRKISDVFIGRHQYQAIKNICNLEDGASTCSDSFGPPGPLHLYHTVHTLLHFLQLLCRILLG